MTKRTGKIWLILAGAGLLTLIFKKMSATNLIAKFEGLKLDAYQDQGGIWTIGYGSTYDPFTFVKVKAGDQITEAEALRWLQKSVGFFRSEVVKLIKVPQKPAQIDALVSLAYNIGLTAFKNSTLLRILNQGAPPEQVADQFLRWNKIKGVISKGLSNRRELERKLYLS